MLRKQIFIGFFLAMSFNAFPNFDIEEFFSLDREMRGVKMITENSFSKWKTVSFFEEAGFLLRKVNYYKNKIRADYRYEYSLSDTLLKIKEKEYQNINNNPESHTIYNVYYNHLRKCHRFEIYSSSRSLEKPFVFGDNFIYKNNQLQSYERHNNFSANKTDFFTKCVYVYDSNQRLKQRHRIYEDSIFTDGCKSISIFQNGKLTDLIHECIEEQGFMGVVCWDNKMNKVHIRFSNFDRRGNWTRSFFITEKGKAFRSERKIEYW